MLTDAVMTAIAIQEPFSDEFLEGLLPLLRHDAALGLWRLVVAATSTVPENAIRDAAGEALSARESAGRRRLLLVAEALDEEVAWHAPARFEVAANIARDMLRSPDATANERLLYEQRAEWDAIRDKLRSDGSARAGYLRGVLGVDWSGRGGAAAWRAERRVEVQDFEEWLVASSGFDSGEREIRPPGWRVRLPSTWCARALPSAATGMAEPYASWVSAGRLMVFSLGPRQVAWPLAPGSGIPGWGPVLGVEPLLTAAKGLRPDQVSGFIEAMLVDWSGEEDHPDFPIRLVLPAHEAFDLGFINADERRRAMAEARTATLQKMASIASTPPYRHWHHRAELQQAMSSTRAFGHLAARLGIEFRVVKAAWTWPGRTVADEILEGTRAEAVQWLARWAYKTYMRMLQQSMQQAWNDAFDHRPASYWLPEPPMPSTM